MTMKSSEKKLYELAVKHWGEEAQLLKTIEELSELQRAIARYLISLSGDNVPKDGTHHNEDLDVLEIYLEMEDVRIMMNQLKVNFNRPDAESSFRNMKLDNLRNLLRKEGEDIE